jgi:hypothetical protein
MTFLMPGSRLTRFNRKTLRGFGEAVNLQLNASAASNLLTVSVKAANGCDPSPTNPVYIPFRDATIGSGDPVWVQVTGPLSINTNAAGATLGSSSGVPFRFWVVAFNNAGSVVLAVINCSTASSTLPMTAAQIFPLDEMSPQSTTAMSGSATGAGTFYTPNGTTLSSKSFRILGYLEYGSGLTTAGTYASAPTKVQLFGPGVRKPGETIQTVMVGTGTITTTTSNTFQSTALTASITPTAAMNLVRCDIYACMFVTAANDGGFAALFRGGTATGMFTEGFAGIGSGSASSIVAVGGGFYDAPFSVSSVTYTWKVRNNDNATQVDFPYINGGSGATSAQASFSEIMG